MNAQSVWPGHEYAYVRTVRRGTIPRSATRVKVISLREYQQAYKTRKDTYAKVTFIDNPDWGEREVNVRNLYDFWDSYQDERQAMYAEEEKREQERRERYERERKEREQRAELERQARERRAAELLVIKMNLAKMLSIDEEAIRLNAYEDFSINASHLKFLE